MISEHGQLMAGDCRAVKWLGVTAPDVEIIVVPNYSGCCTESVLSLQVVYSTAASVPKVETVKPANNKDDDIDIDAI